MGAGLHRAPVGPGRDHDGVDAVHDPFVVRGRAVGIELGETRRVDDAVDDVLAVHLLGRERVGRDAAANTDTTLGAEVREDAEADLAILQK